MKNRVYKLCSFILPSITLHIGVRHIIKLHNICRCDICALGKRSLVCALG